MTEREGGGTTHGVANSESSRLTGELAEARDRIRRLTELLEAAEGAKQASAHETADLASRLRFAEEHARDLATQLEETREAPSWHVLQWVLGNPVVRGAWRAAKRASPTWLRQEVKAWIRTRRGAETVSEAEVLDRLTAFLSRVNDSKADDLVLFVAGVKFIETEGQRVTQLIRALTRDGVPALLLYHRWRSEYHQAVPESNDPHFFQMPMDVFARHRDRVLSHAFRGSLRRTCVFEFPHPWAVDWVREFKSSGWVTIYDVIDDWEEFERAGKALWYESAAERSMLTKCDVVTSVSASLAEKVARPVPGLEVRLIPNGVSIESFDLARAAEPLRCGEVTVGYFGFLTAAWFDWGMVAETARRRPAWEFHIVGFGEPAPANLPRNVQLLGRVPHYLLDSYAKNWDVAIIPCKPNALSRHTDPIKVYEYLALGLPVVATNIPHLRSYAGVQVAESADEFERLLARAAAEELDSQAVASFLEPCAWANRARALLQAGRGARSNERD